MASAHCDRDDLVGALREVGLAAGDVAFCHSNIGFFGRFKGAETAAATCELVLSAFTEVLGSSGTLVVPTFTYSYPNGQIFDPNESASDCGSFSEYIRLSVGSCRSEHPCISVAAVGAMQEKLTENVSKNGYHEQHSFFARFLESKGKIVNLNFDAGSTFVHWVERRLKVPYRFDKSFSGTFRKNGVERADECTLWVRDLNTAGSIARFESFDQISREAGFFKSCKVGRGSVGAISAAHTARLIEETIPTRPWLLTQADILRDGSL